MAGRFTIQGIKFFLAGTGLSFRTGKYFGEALVVGAVTGLVVVAFRGLIDLGYDFLMGAFSCDTSVIGGFDGIKFTHPGRFVMAVMPALGALAGYLLIKRFSKLEHARGTDSAIRAYHQNDGYITSAVIPIKSVASVLTVASGGSAGYEGPVTLIGAACGSAVARLLNLTIRARRILMAAGLAAGIGALFQAPLAGAIFGFEIFYSSSDVEYETLLPSFIASAVSYTIYAYFYGWGSLFTMPSIAYDSGLRLLPYFILAVIITFGVRFYISFFRFIERRFSEWKRPGWLKVTTGGLITGVIGFFIPDILGTGYPAIRAAFEVAPESIGWRTGIAFLLVFVVKVITTSFTVGSGGSGGVFAPALVCGGTLGTAVGAFFSMVLPSTFGIHPAAFALVGMAGFLASAVRIPMTAIVIVAEISGNHSLLLPAMWVCGIAFWLNNDWSLYRSQVHCRESSPVHH